MLKLIHYRRKTDMLLVFSSGKAKLTVDSISYWCYSQLRQVQFISLFLWCGWCHWACIFRGIFRTLSSICNSIRSSVIDVWDIPKFVYVFTFWHLVTYKNQIFVHCFLSFVHYFIFFIFCIFSALFMRVVQFKIFYLRKVAEKMQYIVDKSNSGLLNVAVVFFLSCRGE